MGMTWRKEKRAVVLSSSAGLRVEEPNNKLLWFLLQYLDSLVKDEDELTQSHTTTSFTT